MSRFRFRCVRGVEGGGDVFFGEYFGGNGGIGREEGVGRK